MSLFECHVACENYLLPGPLSWNFKDNWNHTWCISRNTTNNICSIHHYPLLRHLGEEKYWEINYSVSYPLEHNTRNPGQDPNSDCSIQSPALTIRPLHLPNIILTCKTQMHIYLQIYAGDWLLIFLVCVFSPNVGFLEQLKLYEAMGNTVDKTSPVYKQYRLQMLASQIQSGCPWSFALLFKYRCIQSFFCIMLLLINWCYIYVRSTVFHERSSVLPNWWTQRQYCFQSQEISM